MFQINYVGEILHEVSTLDQTESLNRSCNHHFKHLDLSLLKISNENSNKERIEEIQFEESQLKLVYTASLQPGAL